MSDFDLAIDATLANEGGLSEDIDDPGGLTKYGISQRAYPNVNIRDLTIDEAKAIYRRDYWHYDAINDQAVAAKIFDLGVNMGTHQAVKILQLAIGELLPGIVVDGQFGPQTLGAANECDPTALLENIKQNAVAYYDMLVQRNSHLQKFLKGWTERAMS